ncbi:MAG TPA: LapA family protein [Ktedonobacteraceae bacterium]
MLYIALVLLILLVAIAVVIAVQNILVLFSSVHLTLFSWHTPGIPILVLCLLGAFLGGVVLYIVSSISAHRDARELKKLRVRVEELREELQKAQSRSPSGALPPAFAPSAVPMPGIPGGPGGAAGPGSQRPPASPLQNLSPSASGNLALPPRQFQVGGPRPPFPQQ